MRRKRLPSNSPRIVDPPRSEQELRRVERHDYEARHALGQAVDVDVYRIAGLVRLGERLDLLGGSRIPDRIALAEGVLGVAAIGTHRPPPIRQTTERGPSRTVLPVQAQRP